MWVCIKHDCSGMVGDECPHCATARLLQEEKERLLNTKNFPVDCQVKQAACDWINVNDRLPHLIAGNKKGNYGRVTTFIKQSEQSYCLSQTRK